MEDCDKPAKAKGLCSTHYERERLARLPRTSESLPDGSMAKRVAASSPRGEGAGRLRVLPKKGATIEKVEVDSGELVVTFTRRFPISVLEQLL